jgi:hypothetical protein
MTCAFLGSRHSWVVCKKIPQKGFFTKECCLASFRILVPQFQAEMQFSPFSLLNGIPQLLSSVYYYTMNTIPWITIPKIRYLSICKIFFRSFSRTVSWDSWKCPFFMQKIIAQLNACQKLRNWFLKTKEIRLLIYYSNHGYAQGHISMPK